MPEFFALYLSSNLESIFSLLRTLAYFNLNMGDGKLFIEYYPLLCPSFLVN
jgi:hypothetical protein